MVRFLLSLTAACVLITPLTPRAFGQTADPPNGLLKGVFAKGSASSASSSGATRFKPSGSRLLLTDFVNGVTKEEEERKVLQEAFDKMMTEYEKAAKSAGMENDLTLAVTFAVSQYWTLWKGTDIPEGGEKALLVQLQGVLNSPETAKLSDIEKQKLYESILYGAFSLQFTAYLAEQGKDAETKKNVTKAAQGELAKLLGVAPEKIRLTANGIEGAATPPSANGTKATSGELDSVLASYALPEGWEKKTYADGSIIAHAVITQEERNHDCEIRLMAPRLAPSGAAKAFQDLWKETFEGFQAGSVSIAYRRVFPGGAVTHYMGGFYKTRAGAPMYIALYVMDLGGKVLPIVINVVPGRQPQFEYDPNPSALSTLTKAALPFLNSLKFKQAPPVRTALFSREDVIGKWGESNSSMVVGGYYVTSSGNYAGEMMSSYGMDLTLRQDGTFKYRFVYANRGAREVGQDDNAGTFTLSKDMLDCNPKSARSYKYLYKVSGAGFIQTDKGIVRALVLKGPDSKGNFELPPLIPNGKNWIGTVNWLTEDKK